MKQYKKTFPFHSPMFCTQFGFHNWNDLIIGTNFRRLWVFQLSRVDCIGMKQLRTCRLHSTIFNQKWRLCSRFYSTYMSSPLCNNRLSSLFFVLRFLEQTYFQSWNRFRRKMDIAVSCVAAMILRIPVTVDSTVQYILCDFVNEREIFEFLLSAKH